MASAVAMAQKKPLQQAVFQECLNREFTSKCTTDRFKSDITNLISKEITDDISNNLRADFFTVSIILLIDENGRMISEETDILCEYLPLKTAIANYLKLIQLQPKSNGQKDQRSVFTLNYTFVFSPIDKKYYAASAGELYTKKIITKYLPPDSNPVLPGCTDIDHDKESECTQEKLSRFFSKKLLLPSGITSTITVGIFITVDTNGEVTVNRIIGGNEDIQEEVMHAALRLPKLIPAKARGIPIEFTGIIPLYINTK